MQPPADYHRYCPGEQEVKISDAICFGRRRINYPKCKGCQFNDDERGSVSIPHAGPKEDAARRAAAVRQVFKAYDVRGTYPDALNEEIAWRIGHATASYLRSLLTGLDRTSAGAATMVVGRDMRKSSPALAAALIEGIRSTGAPVVDIGLVDTPQVYFAVNHVLSCGGVQTTASHNPAHYNGFKISGKKGVPIGADTGLAEIRRIAENMVRHDTGQWGNLSAMDLAGPYRAFVRAYLQPLRPLKVAVDASNGMAGRWVPIIFDDVPNLELACINTTHDGAFVHEPNPLVDANLRQLQKVVKRRRADFGVCFDGDADRLMVVDEHADIVRCDLLTAVLSRQFLQQAPGSAIVYDLRSSRAVAEEIREAGGIPHRERVGHAYMKKALADAQGAFGGELSGHFYFRDNFYCDSGMLAFVHVLNMLTREKKSLSELIAPIQRYHASGERNFENPNPDGAIRSLAEAYRGARIDYLDGITVEFDEWWMNVRKSNTEPLLRLNLEAESLDLLEEKLAEVAQHLGQAVAR